MSHGPGKYDDLCTQVREQAEAAGAIVLVLDGKSGSGFSVQMPADLHPLAVASMLESVASQIRSDFAAASTPGSAAKN